MKLKTVVPDKIIRQICKQNFNMSESNSPKEIQKCIILEEFKQTDPKHRFIKFGYCEMLKTMLLIEDSFIMDLVEVYNLNNHYIQQLSTTTYQIKVKYI